MDEHEGQVWAVQARAGVVLVWSVVCPRKTLKLHANLIPNACPLPTR